MQQLSGNAELEKHRQRRGSCRWEEPGALPAPSAAFPLQGRSPQGGGKRPRMRRNQPTRKLAVGALVEYLHRQDPGHPRCWWRVGCRPPDAGLQLPLTASPNPDLAIGPWVVHPPTGSRGPSTSLMSLSIPPWSHTVHCSQQEPSRPCTPTVPPHQSRVPGSLNVVKVAAKTTPPHPCPVTAEDHQPCW